MRIVVRSVFVVGMLVGGACFEDSPPVADSGPDNCTEGTEGCPCIDSECVGELVCLSNTCVDPDSNTGTADGSGQSATGPVATSEPGTGTSGADGATTTTDDGPPPPPDTGEPPGDLPPGATCHPLDDQCGPGLACVGLGMNLEMFCTEPGPLVAGDECGDDATVICDAGLLCIVADSFAACNGVGCCAEICDVNNDDCPGSLFCDPFYPADKSPDYADVGICVDFE